MSSSDGMNKDDFLVDMAFKQKQVKDPETVHLSVVVIVVVVVVVVVAAGGCGDFITMITLLICIFVVSKLYYLYHFHNYNKENYRISMGRQISVVITND